MKTDELQLLQAVADKPQGVFADGCFEPIGMHPKRGMYLLGKWASKGWWEYGVTLRSGWLTPEGIAAAKTPGRVGTMADVTGPIPTLPGSRHAAQDGAMCDDHPDRPAVRRVQGETDSFGSEMHDLCQECIDELAKHTAEARCGVCDWCKSEAKDLRPRRDFEEGSGGPVYQVCGACVRRENLRLEAEMDDRGYYDDGGW